MSEAERAGNEDVSLIALKILYTLHGTDSQRYIVKPSTPVQAKVFRDLELGTVDIKHCLNAIKEVSPDFSSICDTHGDEYAVYSIDYAEDGLPLQSHGKVSQKSMTEATGRLSISKLRREQLELLIHLLPVRKPEDMIADFQQKHILDSLLEPGSHQNSEMPQNLRNMNSFPGSFMGPTLLPPLPSHLSVPSSLTNMKSDVALPSSPPVRAKPNRINVPNVSGHIQRPLDSASGSSSEPSSSTPPTVSGGAKRGSSETYVPRKRKALSPKNDNEAQCGNCGNTSASTWRRAKCPDGKGELLCNACGLYYRAKKVMRPRFLWDKMRSRSDQENQDPASTAAGGAYGTSTLGSSSDRLRQPNPSSKLDIASTPQDTPQMLWSHAAAAQYLPSDPSDLSDRLVDNTNTGRPQSVESSLPAILPKATINQDLIMQTKVDAKVTNNNNNSTSEPVPSDPPVEPPSTPERKATFTPLEPDSMQRWLGLSTPDQKVGFMIPGSGSARKWLDRAMNTTNFEDIWNSPTPRKNRSNVPDLSMFTSSPPTSSNMLSEVAEWNLAHPSPGTPQVLKFFRGQDNDIDLDPKKENESRDNLRLSESIHTHSENGKRS